MFLRCELSMKWTLYGLKIMIINFVVIKGNLAEGRKSRLGVTQEIVTDYREDRCLGEPRSPSLGADTPLSQPDMTRWG